MEKLLAIIAVIVSVIALISSIGDGDTTTTIYNISGNLSHGEMWNYTSTGYAFGIPAPNIYYNITGFAEGDLNGFNFTPQAISGEGDKLYCLDAGTYKADLALSFTGGDSQVYVFGIAKNGDVTASQECYTRTTAATESITSTCIIDLALNDFLTVTIKDEAGSPADLRIYTINLNTIRIGD